MISVCMATKNGGRYIREQIDSILPNLTPFDELVISDDCSTDDTISIIKSYADSRIKLHCNGIEKGIAKNFEASLKLCAGDYIFLSDQDDVWMPGKIETMIKSLQLYDLVICDCNVADDVLALKHKSFFQLNNSGRGLLRNLIKNSYMGCCMAFRKSVLMRALPFPSDIPFHDIWIGLIGEMHFRVHFIPKSLVFHRRHSKNASTSADRSRNSLHHKVYNRYRIIRNLILHRPYAAE
jgi:glycosyltransferase involved in cell wall biosynthesis